MPPKEDPRNLRTAFLAADGLLCETEINCGEMRQDGAAPAASCLSQHRLAVGGPRRCRAGVRDAPGSRLPNSQTALHASPF